jgi:hypothetical protein
MLFQLQQYACPWIIAGNALGAVQNRVHPMQQGSAAMCVACTYRVQAAAFGAGSSTVRPEVVQL